MGIAQCPVVEHWNCDQKVTGLIPGRSGGEFSSPGSTFCADSYFSIHSTSVLLQQHVKGPGHSAKSAGSRLQLNIQAPYSFE